VQASYRLHGLHADKVWPAIMPRRRVKLGAEFSDWFDQAGNLKPDIPGKKPAPVREAKQDPRLAPVVQMRRVLQLAAPKDNAAQPTKLTVILA
jgi:hypothetical protein